MADIKTVSVCIIAKNEEKLLGDCLESVASVAKEIVLVDTGSEDNTIPIAESFKCKIIRSKWQDDFSFSRNIAIDNANGTHILSIDADERLLNPHLLVPTIQNSDSTVGGWLIKVVSQARRSDGGSDTYISNLLRLFKNHPALRFNGIIHEQIIDSIINQNLQFKNSPLEFVHLGYNYQVDRMKDKQLRNLNLLNKAIETDPNNAYNLYHRAKTYLSLQEFLKAEQDTQKVLELAEIHGSIRPQALNYGGIISCQLGNYQLAIDRAKASLQCIADQSFAYYILGEAYSYLGDFQNALDAYLNMQIQQNNQNLLAYIVGDYYLPTEQVFFKIGKSYVGLKLYDKANDQFIAGNRVNPKDTNNLIGLSNVAFKQNRFADARNYLELALSYDPSRTEIHKYIEQLDSAQKAFDIYQQENNVKLNIAQDNISPIKSSDKPLITLSMIVKDEENYLPACLESIRSVVDEIIIVDTGSTDNTKSIAEKYGAKVYDFPWINDFSAARNFSLSKSTGEWILYLDADERLSENSRIMIRELISKSNENIAAYICTIESLHLQLDGQTEMHRGGYPRLFRNYGYPKIQFQGKVHEQITPSLFALNKSVDFSDIIIQHLGYDTSREVMESKVKRNYSMLIEHIKEEPLNAYSWFQMGQTLAQMHLLKEAEEAIRMSINIGTLSDSVFASAASTLSQIVGTQKKFEEAIVWADKSLEKAPNQLYALFLKAYSYFYLGNIETAKSMFFEVLRRSKSISGVPRSGFDIVIPEDKILKAIDDCK